MNATADNQPLQVQSEQQLPLRYKSYCKLICLVLVYTLGTFYFSYSMVYLSTFDFSLIVKLYSVDWHQNIAQGIMVSIVPIGAFIGCLMCEVLLKKLSRRQCLLLANAIGLIAGSILYVQDPVVLLITRFFQGISVGIFSSAVPLMVSQTIVRETSNLGVLIQVSISFGFFFAFLFKYVLGQIASDATGDQIWYYVFGFTLLTLTFQTIMILFVFPYETVRYLLGKNKQTEAKQLIQVFYKEQYVENVYKERTQIMPQSTPLTEVQKQVGSDEQNFQQSSSKNFVSSSNNVKILSANLDQKSKTIIAGQQNDALSNDEKKAKTKSPKVAIFANMHIFLLQQFSGINAVVVYGGIAATEALPQLKQIIPIIINFQPFIIALLFMSKIEKCKRRTLLQCGCVVGAISTGLIAVGFIISDSIDPDSKADSVLIIVGMVIHMANFGSSLGPVIWLYSSETVLPYVMPYATGTTWLGTIVITLLFPIIKGALPNQNPAALFFFFCAWCIMSLFINGKFVIESLGKTQGQIRPQFEQIC